MRFWISLHQPQEKPIVTIDERLDRLTGIVETLAGSVVELDTVVEKLVVIVDKNEKRLAMVERQFEAYLKRLPPQ